MFHVKHQPPNNQQEKDNTPQTPPPTTQPSNYVPRETPTNPKHDKTTHPTTKATQSQPTKPQQPHQTNHHVPRETSPKHTTNHNAKTLQWSPHKRIHSKQIIKKQSHIEAYSAAGKIHSMLTDDKPERIRHLSCFSLLPKSSHACQCLETLNHISQQLNKIQNQCFTWNTLLNNDKRKSSQKPSPAT